MPRLCEIEGCGGVHLARGWCEKHYGRWYYNGHPELLVGFSPVSPAEDRFWAKVAKSDGCWEWTAGRDGHNYGNFRVGSRQDGTSAMVKAHRFSWELNVGPIPAGLCVLHHCDNPPCVRPAHLFVGTKGDNNTDRHRKGRTVIPWVGATGVVSGRAKLTWDEVRAIRTRYALGGVTQSALGSEFGVDRQAIAGIIHGRTWKNEPQEISAVNP